MTQCSPACASQSQLPLIHKGLFRDSLGTYVLSDRGTWLAFKNRANLAVLVEGDARLFNPYGAIAVNPAKHPHVKAQNAQRFIDWLTSQAGRESIASFKIGGEQLFFPGFGR